MNTSIKIFATTLLTLTFAWTSATAQEMADSSRSHTYLADNNSSNAPAFNKSKRSVYTDAIFQAENINSVQSYFAEHLDFPEKGISTGKSGSMKVWFEILVDGSVGASRIENSPGAEFDAAVIQCLSNMPQWTPAYLESTPVKSTHAVQLNFRLR